MPLFSRRDYERALVRALSRHIGYTTAAYDLDRIFGVLDLFGDIASAYEIEVVTFLQAATKQSSAGVGRIPQQRYIVEATNFATALRLLEIVSPPAARIRRYAPTQTGRAVMGVQSLEEPRFYRFYRTKLVLSADADAIAPILLLSGSGTPVKDILVAYTDFFRNLRSRRLVWLDSAFPEPRLLERLITQLPWVTKRRHLSEAPQPEKFSLNTARHQLTPRKRWLVRLGLTEEPNGHITSFGRDVLTALTPTGEFFWLGPGHQVQTGLRIRPDRQHPGPFEDTLTFSSDLRAPSESDVGALVEATADVMARGYATAKLVYSPQAPLILPIEYIAYRSYADGLDYSWQQVLDLLFRRYRSTFDRFSARRGPIGFYRVRTGK